MLDIRTTREIHKMKKTNDINPSRCSPNPLHGTAFKIHTKIMAHLTVSLLLSTRSSILFFPGSLAVRLLGGEFQQIQLREYSILYGAKSSNQQIRWKLEALWMMLRPNPLPERLTLTIHFSNEKSPSLKRFSLKRRSCPGHHPAFSLAN